MIQTVLGQIKKEDVGITTTHEHIYIDLTGFFTEHPVRGISDPSTEPVAIENLGILNRDPYALRDNLLMMEPAVQTKEMMYFKNAGGRTVVDASTIGLSRNPALLKQMAIDCDLNVIAGTGYYVGGTHSEEVRKMSADGLCDIMVKELTVGMDDTDIKAGIIGEIGISEVFDDSERNVLRGAARAQKKTGAPLMVHINPWTTNGLEAADIVLSEGVSPDRIAICHIDVENREDYIFRLLNMGLYVEFDNFGKEYYVDRAVRNSGYGLFVRDTDRVRLLKKMIDRGYKNQILLSCDVCLKTCLHTYGGWGYDHVLTNVVPMMDEEGISMQDVNDILIQNAGNYLDWK